MLVCNPKRRLSAKEALFHPWIQKNAPSTRLSHKIFNNLSQFNIKSRFRHAIITFMANRMISKDDLKDLEKAFAALDADGNGILTREELIEGYSKIMKDKSVEEIIREVDKVVNMVDTNQSGEIDFSEFLVAAMNQDRFLHHDTILQAFQLFDEDGDGFIDLEEMKNAMSGVTLSDEEWMELINQFDQDNDGKVIYLLKFKISFEEFSNMLIRMS